VPEEEQGLPSNPYAEKICLATCWVSKHKSVVNEIVTKLTADDFMLSANREIFRAITDLANKGVAIDCVTVGNYLLSRGKLESIGGYTYLAYLDEGMPEIQNYASYIEILQTLTARRRIIYLTDAASKRSFLGDETPQTIASGLITSLREAVSDDEAEGPESIAHFIDHYEKGMDHLMAPGRHEPGLLTGFLHVDEATDGFHQDEIWVLGGYAASGKTALALNIARNVARRKEPVAIFSLEMSKRSLFYRMICTEAAVSYIRFRRGQLSDSEESRIREAASIIYDLPIYIDSRGGITPADYWNRAESLVEKYDIQLAIIDYVQIMQANNKRLMGADRMSTICLDLQNATKKIHVPLLLLSQLSRVGKKEKRKPQMDDLKESSSLEQIADVVSLIYREEQYNRDNASLRGKATLILDKVRNAESKQIALKYIGWRMAFEDELEETEEQS